MQNHWRLADKSRPVKIAFVGHSYHRITRSSFFFRALLQRLGTVTTLWDEGWRSQNKNEWLARLNSFDCIVVWQRFAALNDVINHTDSRMPVVFVPMYDDYVPKRAEFEVETFRKVKIVCFSATLFDDLALTDNDRIKLCRFFPDPDNLPAVIDYANPRGYLWRRTESINGPVLSSLCADVHFEHFEFHDVPDPGSCPPPIPLVSADATRITTWFDNHSQYSLNLSKSNIYFAPRFTEGIGMSFLEAMAMGLCVVAPNTPTHNEYIRNGRTGVLYDIRNPRPVDLSGFAEIGRNARHAMREGFLHWKQEAIDLEQFIKSSF